MILPIHVEHRAVVRQRIGVAPTPFEKSSELT